MGKMVISDELKPVFCQRVANTRIAQRAQLRLALPTGTFVASITAVAN